jgi:hypothetical protein
MPMIELTRIISERAAETDPYSDTDEPGEQQRQTAVPEVITGPVRINAASVRCFYPRKDEKPGTRITFNDGGGFAVIEPYDRVAQLIG